MEDWQMHFIGRERELADLNRYYSMNGFQFPVIYGRRRIGKTTLIRQFIRDKRAAYYMATEQNHEGQLKACSKIVLDVTKYTGMPKGAVFPSWETLFDYIGSASEERFIFVIDEYPYLAKKMPEISSVIQKVIDGKWKDSQLFLILCGSSMSFMEKQVLGYQSPLYGRRTCQFKLKELSYYESIQFFPSWSDEEKLLAYGVCGGVPQYLYFFSKFTSLRDAVISEFMTPGGHLREEPQNLLKQELRDPSAYYDIIAAIAGGAGRQNEIADKVGKERNMLANYLSNLSSLDVIEKCHPVGERSTRKVTYRLKDNLYRFWFLFIPKTLSLIEMGMGERAYDSIIEPHLSDFFGQVFETVSLQYIERMMVNGTIKELYTEFGKWWGTDPERKEQTDIDVVFMNDNEILAGECKWKTDPITYDVYETLKYRCTIIQGKRKPHYALFSKAGFTDTVKKKASDCLLVDMAAICSWK